MIYNAGWLARYSWLLQRLAVLHKDLTKISAVLRDTANEVWTEVPSDASKTAPGAAGAAYSLEGWRSHFAGELAGYNDLFSAYGPQIQSYDGQAYAAMQGARTSIPTIGVALAQIVAGYEDGNGNLIQTKISQGDRDTLATAIEAELQ